MKRWLREPLLHFLALGLLLFATDHVLNRAPARERTPTRIELTPDDLRQLQVAFAARWQREPTPEEMNGLVEDRVRDEVLYREALVLGLGQDDPIVRRRLAQRMELVAGDPSPNREPTPLELEAWFEKNRQRFAQPEQVTFRHLYFSPERRGARARADATGALEKLAGTPADWPGTASLGDRFPFQDHLADRSLEQLVKELGPGFAQAIFRTKPGAWQGPIESAYGWHVVFVEALTPGRNLSLKEIEPDVRTAWKAEQHDASWRAAYEKMRAKYELILPAPTVKESGRPPQSTPPPP
jgi:peptidyl-prolyl cis-trans isomerase C